MNTIDCKVRRSGTERVFGFAVRALARVGERAVGAVRTHRLGSQAGLSVVELVAGLTLVSIIAGTAVPTISRWYGQNELLRGADAVKMDVSRARMKAVSMNRYTRIRILSSKTAYALETSTDGNTWIGTTTINLPPGVTINTTTAEACGVPSPVCAPRPPRSRRNPAACGPDRQDLDAHPRDTGSIQGAGRRKCTVRPLLGKTAT